LNPIGGKQQLASDVAGERKAAVVVIQIIARDVKTARGFIDTQQLIGRMLGDRSGEPAERDAFDLFEISDEPGQLLRRQCPRSAQHGFELRPQKFTLIRQIRKMRLKMTFTAG
jgi:hypothetical protein